MRKFWIFCLSVIGLTLTAAAGCGRSATSAVNKSVPDSRLESLRSELAAIADSALGRVGIAVIAPEGDTVTVNNFDEYQLMSVFKLHEALAVAHTLDLRSTGLDTVIGFERSALDPATWSPMYREHTESTIKLPVRELLRYILQESDNNASNLLFEKVVSVARCDSFVREATGIQEFKLTHTEHEMKVNHASAADNHTSPLAAARLMAKVFTDSLVSPGKQREIQEILLGCKTGTDRIYKPLEDEAGVRLAHKTGSGHRTAEGLLMAHNDVGRVFLPDGRTYDIAVFVKDFNGTEAEAAEVIAEVSRRVYSVFGNRQ